MPTAWSSTSFTHPQAVQPKQFCALRVNGADTNALADVTVTLLDLTYDPLLAAADGIVTFAGTDIPELVDIRLKHGTIGTEDFTNQAVIIGEQNVIPLVLGS